FLRHNRVCEDCLGKAVLWPGVRYACYRASRSVSLVVAGMLGLHRALRTSTRKVHRYLTPSTFARRKLCQGGLPAEQVATKPNFVHPDPGVGQGRGGFALFVGRLSPEKGVETLLNAWPMLAQRLPLKIIGDGPLAAKVCAIARTTPGIDWLGPKSAREVLATVGEAVCLVMPSIWYETFGLTIIEAYAKGTPVVASRLGAMAELVQDGRTGLLFEPGNPDDLVIKINLLITDKPKLGQMRLTARKAYETKFTAETNYRLLMTNYLAAIKTQQRQ
ncbi:MAG: glycosyltransferase family 4 protein, partial [Gammaproteobacteria bacterium]